MSEDHAPTADLPTPTAWHALEPATAALLGLGAELGRLLDHVARRTGSLSFSQYMLLGALRTVHPSPREPWELGRALGAGSAQVSALLDQLERSGLVVRESHEQDRRRRLIRLTDTGVQRVEEIAVRVRAIEELVLARAFGRDGADELPRAAERLRAVVSELVATDLSFALVAEPGRAPAVES